MTTILHDWRRRISEARERGRFSDDDVRQATNDWTTCAIGEWSGSTDGDMSPELKCLLFGDIHTRRRNKEYIELGVLFGLLVEEQDILEAQGILEQIEALPHLPEEEPPAE